MVTHDIEFVAKHMDSCAILFGGELLQKTTTNEFFSNNYFYTTIMNRISRDYIENAITLEDVSNVCKTIKV